MNKQDSKRLLDEIHKERNHISQLENQTKKILEPLQEQAKELKNKIDDLEATLKFLGMHRKTLDEVTARHQSMESAMNADARRARNAFHDVGALREHILTHPDNPDVSDFDRPGKDQ